MKRGKEVSAMDATLTTEEVGLLTAYEHAIETGLDSFIEVGNALARIRDGKLYRATHPTFADYVGERWNMSKSRAYQLINLNEVAEEMSTIVDKPNEAQARELGKLPKGQRAEAWQEAKESSDGKPTARTVQKAVAKRMPVQEIDHGSENGEFVISAEYDVEDEEAEQPKRWEKHLEEHESWFHEELDVLHNDPDLFAGDMLEQLYHSINELHKRAEKEPAFEPFKAESEPSEFNLLLAQEAMIGAIRKEAKHWPIEHQVDLLQTLFVARKDLEREFKSQKLMA
jgi:hypothetical protein